MNSNTTLDILIENILRITNIYLKYYNALDKSYLAVRN